MGAAAIEELFYKMHLMQHKIDQVPAQNASLRAPIAGSVIALAAILCSCQQLAKATLDLLHVGQQKAAKALCCNLSF